MNLWTAACPQLDAPLLPRWCRGGGGTGLIPWCTSGVVLEVRMSKCYLEDAIRTHTHVGPFERCTVCGKTICSECIGRHLPSGAVWCVRCASVSLGDDRLAQFTYRPGSLVYTTSLQHRSPRSIRHGMRRLFRGLAAPFRRPERQSANLNDYRFDLTFTTLNDKVQFGCDACAGDRSCRTRWLDIRPTEQHPSSASDPSHRLDVCLLGQLCRSTCASCSIIAHLAGRHLRSYPTSLRVF